MIELTKLAKIFEDGLNAKLNNPEIQFKIWANAGEYQNALRTGNNIYYELHANLRTTTSSNEANLLVMGVNGLTLDYVVPIQQPRTTGAQTAAELQKIKEGQYEFVEYINKAVNSYFQNATAFEMEDGDKMYSVSMQAGVCTTGVVDMISCVGNVVPGSVFIECYFLEGGLNSRNVVVTVDRKRMPFQNVRIGRANQLMQDVYAGDTTVRNIATANAFSVDADMPANADNTTKQALDFILNGDPNTVHFVNLQYGDNGPAQCNLMMFDSITNNAQGVTFSGLSLSLIQAADKPEYLSVPAAFQVGRFDMGEDAAKQISFTLSKPCSAYIAGKAYDSISALVLQTNQIDPEYFIYDSITGKYYVYMITDIPVLVIVRTPNRAQFEVIKAGEE